MAGKIRPEIQLDGGIGGDKIDGADCKRANVVGPTVPVMKQLCGGVGDLQIALRWKRKLALILPI